MSTGHLRDLSISVTAGATAQDAEGDNAGRQYILVHNPLSESEKILVDIGATAAANTAVELASGGSLIFENSFIPTGKISILAATTGHKVVVKVA